MDKSKKCLVCQRSETEIPMTRFYYKKSDFFICAQHIPILIHDPQKLVGLIPGAEKLEGA